MQNEENVFLYTLEQIGGPSSGYLELVWGKYSDDMHFWNEDSMYIEGYTLEEIHGMDVLRGTGALPEFDYFENTVVTKNDWIRMKRILNEVGGPFEILLYELEAWVGDGFETHDCFTILGS